MVVAITGLSNPGGAGVNRDASRQPAGFEGMHGVRKQISGGSHAIHGADRRHARETHQPEEAQEHSAAARPLCSAHGG